jgi:Arc/MetJ-type ribon-helix-helix transcriptional regulator
MRIYLRGQMAQPTAKTYHRTTVYLTDEQRQWLRRAAAKAQLEGLTVSASDVIRLALSRLQEQVSDKQLHQDLAAHVLAEAEQYPGRAKHGLPAR